MKIEIHGEYALLLCRLPLSLLLGQRPAVDDFTIDVYLRRNERGRAVYGAKTDDSRGKVHCRRFIKRRVAFTTKVITC